MFGICQNTKLPQFFVEIFHVFGYDRFDSAEIMVVKFLVLRWFCTNEGPAAEDEVFSFFVELFRYKEVFLLGAYCRYDS